MTKEIFDSAFKKIDYLYETASLYKEKGFLHKALSDYASIETLAHFIISNSKNEEIKLRAFEQVKKAKDLWWEIYGRMVQP